MKAKLLEFSWTKTKDGRHYCEVDRRFSPEAFIIECAEMRRAARKWGGVGRVAYTVDKIDFSEDFDGEDAGTIIQGHALTDEQARQDAQVALERWLTPPPPKLVA